jgi:TRAP-type C4-dicarboxylate transport system substrate-binding protein
LSENISDHIEDIGERVRAARKALSLRQTDLSELAGIPPSHLSDIERGMLTPTIPTLSKIGKALNRPIVYFLQSDQDRHRSIGTVIHHNSIGGKAATKFAELVEAQSDGEMKIRIYHYSTLGTAVEQVQGLAEGAIDIYIDELLCHERYAEFCGPVCLPYFFRDQAHYHRFLNSDIFETHIYNTLMDSGIRLLKPVSSWESGSFEMLLSTDPIFEPGDLIGRKFRTYESQAAVALRQALGAEPVVVEWARTPQAIMDGLVDTFLMPGAYLDSIEPETFASYATVLTYGYTIGLNVAMNDHEYRKMPPDMQAILIEAAEQAGAYCTQLVNERTAHALEQLPDAFGLPVIRPDQQLWREVFDAAIQEICSTTLLPPGMYETLQNL